MTAVRIATRPILVKICIAEAPSIALEASRYPYFGGHTIGVFYDLKGLPPRCENLLEASDCWGRARF